MHLLSSHDVFLFFSTPLVLFLPTFFLKNKLLPPPKKNLLLFSQPSGYSVADWAAAFDSQLEEFDYQISKKKKGDDDGNKSGPVAYVEGEIPEALRGGTLYRNGPARFERGGERYAHMLDGDGYVCRFEFSGDGESVDFRSRFVKTR